MGDGEVVTKSPKVRPTSTHAFNCPVDAKRESVWINTEKTPRGSLGVKPFYTSGDVNALI